MKKNLKNKKAFSLIELSIVILIVGIVVAGVTQASRLVSAFKLSAARNITQSSPVNSIKDLALWLESTSEKSFDASDQDDGLQVDNWYDINPQSTTKINFTQGTSANQPLYKTTAGINSLPTIKFDGVKTSNGDYLQNNTVKLSELTQADQITIFLVEKVNTNTNNSAFFVNAGSAGDVRLNFSGPEANLLVWEFGTGSSGNARTSVAMPSGFIGNAKVTTLIRTPANLNITRVNGTQLLSSAATSTFTTAQLATTTTFDLQCISIDTAYCNDSYFGELIIFRRALKADEITDVERYLGKKWGIVVL